MARAPPFKRIRSQRGRKVVWEHPTDQRLHLRHALAELSEDDGVAILRTHARVPARLLRDVLTQAHQRTARDSRRRQPERKRKMGLTDQCRHLSHALAKLSRGSARHFDGCGTGSEFGPGQRHRGVSIDFSTARLFPRAQTIAS